MTGWQLIFLAYTIPGVPMPELDHAELKPYPDLATCTASGSLKTVDQVIPKGTQRVAVCAFIDFPPPPQELGL